MSTQKLRYPRNRFSIIQFLTPSLHSSQLAEINHTYKKLMSVSLRVGFLPFPRI